jgi:hypothetical protein
MGNNLPAPLYPVYQHLWHFSKGIPHQLSGTAHENVLEYQQEKDNVRDRLDTSETPLSASIE